MSSEGMCFQMKKYNVGIIGATGMVGQRFITLLENHPWFIGTQAHPELKSRPNRPHPLFNGFISASLKAQEK